MKPSSTVQTVLGPMSTAELGTILPHEHLYSDDQAWSTVDPTSPDANRPITLDMLGRLRRDPSGVTLDNLHIDDPDLIVDELSRYRAAGGRTLVDLTSQGCGPNPDALPDIARRTDVNIVASCGYYIDSTHPPEIRRMSVAAIADVLIKQIREGIGHTAVLPGIIGEIGTSSPVTASEERVVRGSARAAMETGVGLSIHLYPWGREALNVINFALEEGMDPGRMSLDHLDVQLDLEYHLEIAKTGVLMGFDAFGVEYYWDKDHLYFPTDRERVVHLVELCRRGLLDQLLVSQDIAHKTLLVRYGGWGYGHILEHIRPMLSRYGLTQDEIRTLLEQNPIRLLAGA